MKIESLSDLAKLPIAESDWQVDERVVALLEFSSQHALITPANIAEGIVYVLTYVSYSEKVSINVEHRILEWISRTFDENNVDYMNAISTIYANLSGADAINDLKLRILKVNNLNARNFLMEALRESL